MAIRAVIFDYDGTILNSFFSVSRLCTFVKIFCFKYLKPCYVFLEALEIFLRIRWFPHTTGVACMSEMKKAGVLVCIATDRSWLGLAISARRSGVSMHLVDVVRVRASILDGLIRDQPPPVLFRSRARKDAPRGLDQLGEWLTALGISPSEVLLIGDDERDHRAAANHGFLFVGVDRHNPDFAPVHPVMAQPQS